MLYPCKNVALSLVQNRFLAKRSFLTTAFCKACRNMVQYSTVFHTFEKIFPRHEDEVIVQTGNIKKESDASFHVKNVPLLCAYSRTPRWSNFFPDDLFLSSVRHLLQIPDPVLELPPLLFWLWLLTVWSEVYPKSRTV